jgi:hypothetical protein
VDKELNANEIIQLSNLITQLRCKDTIIVLKNHYLKKFPNLLNDNNWLQLLKSVYNISKYADFQEVILSYYKNNVLTNIDTMSIVSFDNQFKDIDQDIRQTLFSLCLEKLALLLNEIKLNQQATSNKTKLNNSVKKLINDSDNESSSESEKEEEEEEEEPIQKVPAKKAAIKRR